MDSAQDCVTIYIRGKGKSMFNYKYLQYSTSLFFIRFVSNFFKLGSALLQHLADMTAADAWHVPFFRLLLLLLLLL